MPYRWTLAEYVLRAELARESLREVIVEGRTDRAFFEGVLERYGAQDVTVFDSEYFVVEPGEVEAAGFSHGVKGALLTLALAIAESAEYANNEALVVVVVDRNADGVPDRGLVDYALATDYYSLESYALTERSLEQFVRQVLVRETRPQGLKGRTPGDRNACSGEGLLERLLPACIEIGGMRLLLRSLDTPVQVVESWADYFTVEPDGTFATRPRDLLVATLTRQGSLDEDVIGGLDQAFEVVQQEPRKLVRGRDFVRLLHKVLKSSWGRRVSSVNFAGVDEPTLTTWLLAAVSQVDLDAEPLFVTLRARLQLS